MTENEQIAIPLFYEIYMQDLSHDWIDLTFLGIARTREEASNACQLFREAIETANSRGVNDKAYRTNCTVFFRPVIKNDPNKSFV